MTLRALRGIARVRCAYCGRYVGNGHSQIVRPPRTCKRHSDLPELDATFNPRPERMQSNA